MNRLMAEISESQGIASRTRKALPFPARPSSKHSLPIPSELSIGSWIFTISLHLRGMADGSFRVSCHGFVYEGYTWLTDNSGAQKDLGLWERCFTVSVPWRNFRSACLLISKHPVNASPVFLLIPQIHVCHLENCTVAEDITPLYLTSPRKVIADPYNG